MSFDLDITNGDLTILADGSFKTVQNNPKLVQDIVKIIITPLGSNRFEPWYGCDVGDKTIGRSLSPQLMLQEIQTSIQQSLDNLKQLQLSQASSQLVSLAEQINSIKSIKAEYDPSDSRQINVTVTVITKRLEQIEEVFTISS